jgi:hypothetical protein
MTIAFPYVFIRYASLPCNTLHPLQLWGAERFIQIQGRIEQLLSEGRQALCGQLYQLIPAQTSDATRNKLINLKRHIYNDKPVTGSMIADMPDLPPALTAGFHQYCRLQQKLIHLQRNWQLYYDAAIPRQRQHVQQLSANESLQQGLLLSSFSLYEQLADYRKKAAADFRHKELKTEQGLLRYLTRMAFKTSPFSTFTSTGLGLLNKDVVEMELTYQPQTRSRIRCNSRLFTYIHDLLLHHPELNNVLLIRLNDTAAVDDKSIRFLVNYYNIESFQQLPATVLLQWIVRFFEHRNEVSLEVLTNELVAQVSDTDRGQVKAYLVKLIETGFLEAGTNTSGLHPNWDEELYNFLQGRVNFYPSLYPLCNSLQQLSNARIAFGNASAAKRHQLLLHITSELNQILQQLYSQTGSIVTTQQSARDIQQQHLRQWQEGKFTRLPFMPHQFSPVTVFFEDCSVAAEATIPKEFMQQFVAKTQTLGRLLSIFDPLQQERQHMRDFFLKQYGPAATIPVLNFYHTYFLKDKKHLLLQASEQRAENEPAADKWQQLLKQVQITQSKTMPYTVCINAAPSAGDGNTTGAGSMAMFIQFFREGSRYKGVINHFLPGMGKIAGRFLYLFDEQVTQTFNEWNNKLHAGAAMVELSDCSGFNANIHPPLLPYELHIPGSQHNFPAHRQLQVKDLVIQYDAAGDALYLYHQQLKTRVYAFDLSLESFYRRSHFYQLLAHFNAENRISVRQFNKAVDKWIFDKSAAAGDILFNPRIVFEEDVILRRAGWRVQTGCIPVQSNQQTEAAWFAALNSWRIQHQIPEQVFVYLRSPYSSGTENNKAGSRDDYKPQYIHFGMPLLAGVFKKMIGRSKQVYLEEMLPHTAHWQQVGEQAMVTEQLIHWYNFHEQPL